MDGCGSPGIWVCPCQRGGADASQTLHIYTPLQDRRVECEESKRRKEMSWKKGAGQKRLTPPLEMGFMVLVEGGMGRKGLGRCDATLGIAAAGGAGRVPRRKWAWWYEQRHEVGVLAAGRAGAARWRVGCVVAAVEAEYVPRVKWA